MTPSVLALICTNKIENQFFDSLFSICQQDYNNLQIAIFLDGVNDFADSQLLINDFCRSHKRLCVVHPSPYNVGLTKGLIYLQRNSNVDFFARLDVGDLWHKSKISRQIQLCVEFGYSIIGTRSEYIDEDSNVIGLSQNLPNNSDMLINRITAYQGLYDHSTILFSSSFRYDSRWFYSQDMKLYVDIAKSNGSFGYLSEPLTKVRFNPLGITISKRPMQIYFEREARKSFYTRDSETLHIMNISELTKPNRWFSYFYKNFVLLMQSKNYYCAFLSLLVACLLDLRLFGYYLDRVSHSFRMPSQRP